MWKIPAKCYIYIGEMMVGRVDSLKRSFEVYGALQRNMRCTAIATVLVLLLLMPAAGAQTSGRDVPNCLERDIDQLLNSVTVDSSVCVKVNLGNLEEMLQTEYWIAKFGVDTGEVWPAGSPKD